MSLNKSALFAKHINSITKSKNLLSNTLGSFSTRHYVITNSDQLKALKFDKTFTNQKVNILKKILFFCYYKFSMQLNLDNQE